jgi:hypothetical protein
MATTFVRKEWWTRIFGWRGGSLTRWLLVSQDIAIVSHKDPLIQKTVFMALAIFYQTRYTEQASIITV